MKSFKNTTCIQKSHVLFVIFTFNSFVMRKMLSDKQKQISMLQKEEHRIMKVITSIS